MNYLVYLRLQPYKKTTIKVKGSEKTQTKFLWSLQSDSKGWRSGLWIGLCVIRNQKKYIWKCPHFQALLWLVSMYSFPISMELYIWFLLRIGNVVILFYWDMYIDLMVYIHYYVFWTIIYTICESTLSHYLSFPLRKYHWIYAFEYEYLHIYWRNTNQTKWN